MGDAINTVLIFAGELLKAESLLVMGLHPSEVIKGYELAYTKALAELKCASHPTSMPLMDGLYQCYQPASFHPLKRNRRLRVPSPHSIKTVCVGRHSRKNRRRLLHRLCQKTARHS